MNVSEFELERLLMAKMAERDCQNLIGRYCHYRTACRTDDILAIWSAEPDARVEMPWGVYDGPEGVRRLFTQELTAHDDLSARRGKLDIDALSTGVIEVAADVKTARGAWFSQGLRTRADQGEAECDWYWTKLAVDFRYEADSWKLWHMAYFPMLASPYQTPWYDVPKLTVEQFSAYHPDRKPTARTLWSFHRDNQYPLGHPATPKPYDNFDLEVGYGY
jgi:hypothetical protein